jgi:hypothetical protein
MTDDNFHKLALSESFERVAKVAEERAAFNAGVEAAAKPDPLVDIVEWLGGEWTPEEYVKEIRAALEARGLEIREKNDG